ncbi:MAG: hypothetical protein F4Y02_00590 [Chloroflexi bacterium]|nr:hypothetical protein [Chloroflexota bacterium]
MSPEDKDAKGWGRRLDGLIKRVGDEVGGERGEKVRARLTEAKSRVEAGLESEEARRIRSEMVTLGDKAMNRVDDALRHERTQQVVKQVDATLTEIGDRLRGDQPEPPASAPPPKERDEPADSQATSTQAGTTSAGPEAAAAEAEDVSPDISTNSEDETPTKRA